MIAIIDYGMGNLQSIKNALDLLYPSVAVIKNPSDLKRAKAIVLPGVGAFADGMRNLRQNGFLPVLKEEVLVKKKPYLGICLGMQFLAEKSHEHGVHEGLGWINGEVKRLNPCNGDFKIPHVGWNDVKIRSNSNLYQGIGEIGTFYFVHSYALDPANKSIITGVCDHGQEFVASIQQENIFGVQFHPEKSQGAGMKLLKNFMMYVENG